MVQREAKGSAGWGAFVLAACTLCPLLAIAAENDAAQQRAQMIHIIEAHVLETSAATGRDTLDWRIIRALSEVPRHEFVPEELRPASYADHPLPIGYGQTISQPFIVALM